MCTYAIRIDQPERVGSTLVTFKEQGAARAVVDQINTAQDERTSAAFLGVCSQLHVTQTLDMRPEAKSARQQVMDAYNRALPHREAWDVTQLTIEVENGHHVAAGYVLGGFRKEELA